MGLHGLKMASVKSVDMDTSLHIRDNCDSQEKMPSFKHQDINHLHEVNPSEGAPNVSRGVVHPHVNAKRKFERQLLSSRLDDLSHAFPTFTKTEVLVGRFCGHGSTARVSQVNGLQITDSHLQGQAENVCPRSFMVRHCHRESGDARYVIKSIRQEVVAEGNYLLQQAIIDLNLETRFLAHLTAHPHPKVIKLRAVASGDRFSPSYFILLDRLYDTLETRLVRWSHKARSLDNSVTWLRSFLGEHAGKRSPKSDLLKKRFELLDDQLKAVSGLSSAIAYLHKCGVMHRDIKPTNMGFNVRNNIMVRNSVLGVEKRVVQNRLRSSHRCLPRSTAF